MSNDPLEQLRQQLAEFAAARDWDQFHSPKNLSMALIAEVAELIEHFQWLTPEQSEQLSPEQRQAVSYELADIFIYLIRLSDKLNVDLMTAAQEKIKINENRYPVALAKGSARRSVEYLEQKQDIKS
ncbi:MAG: nucleotide pyrophosphohydrolase [Beggiatoa sp. IS2]|nr:MAG: nucleotide pyrophosphohydrolase [Beggiatoa sp. IS2]